MDSAPRLLTLYLPDGPALKKLLQEELERGAIFVPTVQPPELGSLVSVRVQVRDYQSLELEGTVVHASGVGDPGSLGPGAGLIIQGAARVILAARKLLQEFEESEGAWQQELRSSSGSTARTATPPGVAASPTIGSRRSGTPTGHLRRMLRATTSGTAPAGKAAADSRVPRSEAAEAAAGGQPPVEAAPAAAGQRAAAASSRPAAAAAAAAPAPAAEPPPAEKTGGIQEQLQQRIREYQDLIAGGADFYRLLGLRRNATPDEIRRSFFGLAREFHPDAHFRRVPQDFIRALESIYQRVGEAYQVLSSAEKRLRYDLQIGKGMPQSSDEPDTAVPQRSPSGKIPPGARDRHGERLGRAKALYEKAVAAQQSGDLIGAQSSLKLALTHDPLHKESLELLRAIEDGLAHRPDTSRKQGPAKRTEGDAEPAGDAPSRGDGAARRGEKGDRDGAGRSGDGPKDQGKRPGQSDNFLGRLMRPARKDGAANGNPATRLRK